MDELNFVNDVDIYIVGIVLVHVIYDYIIVHISIIIHIIYIYLRSRPPSAVGGACSGQTT